MSTKPRNLESSYMPVFTVGESFARAIGKILKIPVYTFSHQENHLGATLYGKDLTIEDPVLFVHLSGGTTEIVLAKPGIGVDFFDMKVLGESMDISAGQLIDRVGVKLGMPFPAGPYMEMESNQMEKKGLINKPNPLKVCEKNGNLFFSGIETKVLKMITSGQYEAAVIARNLEELIAKSLIQSIGHAHNRYPVKTIIIAGGVAANKRIRRILNDGLPAFTLCFPEEKFSGDHGVGVALLAKRVLENSRR